MNTFYTILKIFFSFIFIVYSIFIIGLLSFFSKQTRFELAENLQGTLLSQKMFDILIFQYPDYSEAYMEKSVAYNKRGEYAIGFKFLNKAVEIDPDLQLGYRGWLRLMKLKDYKGALQDLKKMDSLNSYFPSYAWGENSYYLKGICYQGLGNYEEAKLNYNSYYNSEKELHFINTNIFVYHGNILTKQDSITKAIQYYDKALKYNRDCIEAYYFKGLAFKKLNLVDSMETNLIKALNLYDRSYKKRDIYDEVFEEIYREEISTILKK